MKRLTAIAILLLASHFAYAADEAVSNAPATNTSAAVKSIYDFTLNDITGKPTSLSTYTGKVVLIVNVASKCGFTKQYAGLEKLYETYKAQGLVLLGFPANNFMGQEPGSNDEIAQFCKATYGVTFPMFAKISVKGDDIDPLYAYLTSGEPDPAFPGDITWNFNKFLIGRDGHILNRFGSKITPEDKDLVAAIEAALKTTVNTEPQSLPAPSAP